MTSAARTIIARAALRFSDQMERLAFVAHVADELAAIRDPADTDVRRACARALQKHMPAREAA